MNMNRIGFIFFVIIIFGIQPLFGQPIDPQTETLAPPTQDEKPVENDEQNGEVVSPSTSETPAPTQEEAVLESEKQDTESASPSIPIDGSEQEEPIPKDEVITEEPQEVAEPTSSKWDGKRRILKVVNDYQLKTDKVITTLVMIAGDAIIHGTVTGNVLLIGGDVELAPGAQVKGMVQVIGGNITGTLESVENYSVSNNWRILPAVAQLLMHPHAVWDISKYRNFRLTLTKFLFLLLIYLSIVLVFPKPINATSSLLARRPIGSLLFGLLMFVVIPVVFTVLILSIIGVPFLLLCICLLVPAALCGKAAIFFTLGSTLLTGRLKPLAVIFGFIPYFMATEIPHVDWVTFLLFNIIGVGLCILSILSTMSSKSQGKNVRWSERAP